ncbi:MBL fold metallo-hydrolase [Oharaeibacter diazotrophicus]|uniref:Metallo-beta-lactamase family protein n=2 Tax=Oharaeibacter diazotrophicus TaxID=1920512 RepID=A0A4R6R9P9_9HYPH|nr:MBL fold metallo-hydrolase [Oharaeibacter diazotrophicus]TDP82337.1 metallo-beta-lactamase family protein [Oharaeibacter diazotrophicus]BBE72900.1 ribonuclease [Pleomorphomonas sp. SM30]
MPGSDPVLHVHGAAGTVTGSCFLVETARARVLVDCGMFQGSKTEKELNYRPFPFDPATLDAVVLTHAHIDHAGLIPKLVLAGYRGPVHATPATVDLASIMLPDSGHIQEVEVEQLNRRNARRGRDPVAPIYRAEDAEAALTQFRGLACGHWQTVADGVRVRLWNAGHLLGSASVEMEVEAGGGRRRLLFSGDLGPDHKLLQHDPEAPAGFDYVICESTYGDTDRPETSPEKRRRALRTVVREAIRPSGALLIPSFAVERTQELLVDLTHLMEAGEIPVVPLVIDSPLATRASRVFAAHAGEIEDGATLTRAMAARNVRFTESVEQSKALDLLHDFHIVIAASGMCEAGRIRHRLKNWLWREEATVLLVGYQAEGTLGRILENGAATVRIQGEEIKVRARIRSTDLYSGHADGPELARWVAARAPIAAGLFLVHGEGPALAGLAARVEGTVPAARVHVPTIDAAYALGEHAARPLGGAAAAPARIDPRASGRQDWHNELSRLMLDVRDKVGEAADERARAAVLRRIRRALEEG